VDRKRRKKKNESTKRDPPPPSFLYIHHHHYHHDHNNHDHSHPKMQESATQPTPASEPSPQIHGDAKERTPAAHIHGDESARTDEGEGRRRRPRHASIFEDEGDGEDDGDEAIPDGQSAGREGHTRGDGYPLSPGMRRRLVGEAIPVGRKRVIRAPLSWKSAPHDSEPARPTNRGTYLPLMAVRLLQLVLCAFAVPLCLIAPGWVSWALCATYMISAGLVEGAKTPPSPHDGQRSKMYAVPILVDIATVSLLYSSASVPVWLRVLDAVRRTLGHAAILFDDTSIGDEIAPGMIYHLWPAEILPYHRVASNAIAAAALGRFLFSGGDGEAACILALVMCERAFQPAFGLDQTRAGQAARRLWLRYAPAGVIAWLSLLLLFCKMAMVLFARLVGSAMYALAEGISSLSPS
jgi:hypothetical protein